MLEVEGINVFYGDLQALWDVSLKVESGEITAIIGSNGAGKTTLLKSIAGLLKPKSGSLKFLGERIDKLPSYNMAERGLALVPEGRGLFPRMKVYENLIMGAYSKAAQKRINENFELVYEMFPILKERKGQQASTLSGGEQQMLAIARGLMSNPRLLMLDEPSQGLGPIVVEKIFDVIKHIIERGVTILLVEQSVTSVLELADKAHVLETGRIAVAGTREELTKDEKVKQSYLGT